MKQSTYLVMAIAAAFAFASEPAWIGHLSGQAEAAQTTTKKTSTKKPAKKKTSSKKSYCGYPAPPNPAGMSDFCAMQYDFYCRRGVGCNQFGR
jgi:hypothetical protein